MDIAMVVIGVLSCLASGFFALRSYRESREAQDLVKDIDDLTETEQE